MKAVVLNSGGVDSLASMLRLTEIVEDLTLYSLYVNIGQDNHELQKVASEKIAKELCVSHEVLDMPDLSHYERYPNGRKHFPYQTSLFGIVGAMIARRLGAGYIVIGIDNSKTDNYEKRLASVFAEGRDTENVIVPLFPVKALSREERLSIVKAHPLGSLTVTCWQDPKCGECHDCLERIEIGLD